MSPLYAWSMFCSYLLICLYVSASTIRLLVRMYEDKRKGELKLKGIWYLPVIMIALTLFAWLVLFNRAAIYIPYF